MKEFLSQKQVPFEDRNVKENPAYRKEVEELGASALPVVKIGDKVIIGKRMNEITSELTAKGLLK